MHFSGRSAIAQSGRYIDVDFQPSKKSGHEKMAANSNRPATSITFRIGMVERCNISAASEQAMFVIDDCSAHQAKAKCKTGGSGGVP